MAAPTFVTAAVRSIKNGVLTFEDSAASTLTVTFQKGGIKGDLHKKDYTEILHRGALMQFLEQDDQVQEVSIDMHMVELNSVTTGATWASLTPIEILRASANNAFTFATTSTGIATGAEPPLFNVKLTITEPGSGADTETIVWSKCLCTMVSLEEGYPNSLSATIRSRGGVPTITYAVI